MVEALESQAALAEMRELFIADAQAAAAEIDAGGPLYAAEDVHAYIVARASGKATLDRHPNIGRPRRGDLRELVISHGRTGYVALYRLTRQGGQVEILALRHQREAGFG
jgi:plasmid stabilization system protein ParE